jgi:uncharacterized membrane protein
MGCARKMNSFSLKPGDAMSVFQDDASGIDCPGGPLKRYAILYLVTLIVLIPLDFLFLGVIAKPFFKAEVGDMLGDLNILPAAIFYLLYTLGVLIFVTGSPNTNLPSSLIYGALFGLFAYATFDLTALATLKHWSWPAAFADVSWGATVTAISATAGLTAAKAFATA